MDLWWFLDGNVSYYHYQNYAFICPKFNQKNGEKEVQQFTSFVLGSGVMIQLHHIIFNIRS